MVLYYMLIRHANDTRAAHRLQLTGNASLVLSDPVMAALGCSLTVLSLQGNKLFGSVPRSLPTGLPRLLALDLSYNGLSGTLPLGLGDMASLQLLDVSYNLLSGTLPADLCRASNGAQSPLAQLTIGGNGFGGSIDIRNCSDLVYIDASVSPPLLMKLLVGDTRCFLASI